MNDPNTPVPARGSGAEATPGPASRAGSADAATDAGATGLYGNGAQGEAPRIPGYEILGVVGRGGMGVVYKARQLALNRVTALKSIRAGAHAGPEEISRFRAEAEAVARLQHPHIVQIFEVGEHAGRPFFSLEFVGGGSLDRKLAGAPLPPCEAAALVEKLARAVQCAHERGVVHRDLKPANVLLAEDGTPKVADFGLAKLLRDGPGQTQTGDVLGTPSYMAPEQAGGRKDVGPAADVYALGAVLYECLTGRPPFHAASTLDTLELVRSAEPVPPGRLQPKTPRDLETICLKCLHKEPGRRYGSAGDLADDCAAFLRGEPVKARPVGAAGRAWSWAKRRPTLAAAYGLAGLTVLLALGGAGAAWYAWGAEAARRTETDLRGKAEEARKSAEDARKIAESLKDRLDQTTYLHSVQLAYQNWQDNDVGRAIQVLDECPESRRGWEWRYVKRLTTPSVELTFPAWPPECVAFSPDGERLLYGNKADGVRVWDVARRKDLPALEQSGLKKGANGAFAMVDGAPIRLAFTRDGGRVVARLPAGVTVWETATGKLLGTPIPIVFGVGCLALNPDGTRLASGVGDENVVDFRVRLWDLEAGTELPAFTGHKGRVKAVAYSRDGKTLASGGEDRTVKLWDAASGKERFTFKGFAGPVRCLDFRPDGLRLAAGSSDGALKVWDVTGGEELTSARVRTGGVNALAYSPDGKRLATGTDNGTVVVWDADAGREAFTLRGHVGPNAAVVGVSYGADGTLLASAGGDRTVKVWDATGPQEGRTYRSAGTARVVGRLGPGGRLFTGPTNGVVQLWDVDDKRLLSTFPGASTFGTATAVSADGRHVAFSGDGNTCRLWNVPGHTEVGALPTRTGPVLAAAFSADGARLATGSAAGGGPGEVQVWDAATGREGPKLTGAPAAPGHVALSPDGRRAAAMCQDGTVQVWDAETGEELFRAAMGQSGGGPIVFSPNGEQLAAGAGGDLVQVWDARTWAEVCRLRGPDRAFGLGFSPDGSRLAAGGVSVVTVWDMASGRQALTLKTSENVVFYDVAFGADGNRLLAAGGLSDLTVWDATPLP